VTSSPATGASTRVEALGASEVAIGADGPYVARTSRVDRSLGDGVLEIARVTSPGTTAPMLTFVGAPGGDVASVAADGDVLAFVVVGPDDVGALHVVDVPTSAVTVVPLGTAAWPTAVAVCSSTVAWTSSNGGMADPDEPVHVLDTVSGELLRVAVHRNYAGVYCAGDHLAWRTLDNATDARATTTVVRWHPDGT